jgi:hypothetical protein
LTQAQGALSNGGQTSEVASNSGTGLANYDGAGTDIGGPARVGFIATSSTDDRTESSASFYGAMEMSGNVWERAATVGNAAGRGFSGTHGDGVLNTLSSYEGNATNLDWPGISSSSAQGVTGAAGSGLRGGGFASTATATLTVSSRTKGGTTDATRGTDYGGRLVRTAS